MQIWAFCENILKYRYLEWPGAPAVIVMFEEED